jgi:hypothetical protein
MSGVPTKLTFRLRVFIMNHAPGGTRKGGFGGTNMINYLAENIPNSVLERTASGY